MPELEKTVPPPDPRAPRSTRRTHAQHMELIDEMVRLRMRGATLKKCAEILGVHEQTVRKWSCTSEFKVRYLKTRGEVFRVTEDKIEQKGRVSIGDIEALIEKYSLEAVQIIYRMMNKSEDEKVQLKAAQDLADRGQRTSKTKKVQSTHAHAIITPESLAAIAATAREIEIVGRPVEPLELDASMLVEVEEE